MPIPLVTESTYFCKCYRASGEISILFAADLRRDYIPHQGDSGVKQDDEQERGKACADRVRWDADEFCS
jgi:hypothetical protein